MCVCGGVGVWKCGAWRRIVGIRRNNNPMLSKLDVTLIQLILQKEVTQQMFFLYVEMYMIRTKETEVIGLIFQNLVFCFI